LALDGFASIGQNGGAVSLSEKENSKIAAEAVLPRVAQVLGVNASVARSVSSTTTISIPSATPRNLNRIKFKSYLGSSQAPDELKMAYSNATLVMVVSDVVVSQMDVKICRSTEMDAGLKAKLDEAVGKIVGQDASLTLSVSNTADGCYSLNVVRPVIISTLAKKRPAAGELENVRSASWADWDVVGYGLERTPFTIAP
jgi:hypothetical protein